MTLFDKFRNKASDAAGGVVEPVETVMNAVLIGGLTAGLLMGGAYLFSKVKNKRKS